MRLLLRLGFAGVSGPMRVIPLRPYTDDAGTVAHLVDTIDGYLDPRIDQLRKHRAWLVVGLVAALVLAALR